MRSHIIEALKGNQVTFEHKLHGPHDGCFHVTITPDFGLDDAVEGFFISLLDITERKALEEKQRQSENQFRDLAKERAELLSVKDQFLRTVSHELRTPLTAIVGWARLISSRTLSPDRVKEGLAAIERNAQSQSVLVEDLLDISRITSGTMRLELSLVQISDLVKQTVESLEPAFTEKQLKLILKMTDDIPAIRGDRERLQQVIMNLLANALKFTPPGGNVRVDVKGFPAEVLIEIADTGQGIPQDFLPHVFDEFRQADVAAVRKSGGLGLGLSIARKIVELHHGTICVFSAGPGQGATFRINLPVYRSNEDPLQGNWSPKMRLGYDQ